MTSDDDIPAPPENDGSGPADGPPAIAPDRLAELKELRADLGDAPLRGILASFERDVRGRLGALREGLAAGDTDAMALAAHGLKGTGLGLGANALFRHAADLEHRCRDGSTDGAEALIEALESATRLAVRTFAEEVLGDRGPAGGDSPA